MSSTLVPPTPAWAKQDAAASTIRSRVASGLVDGMHRIVRGSQIVRTCVASWAKSPKKSASYRTQLRTNLRGMQETAYPVFHGATALAQRMRAERPRDGTTLSMISAMSHLGREGAMTAGRLAALQRAKPQTVTRTLARLTELGWIERSPGQDDRRQILVELTPAGRERLAADMRPRVAWLDRAMESLSPTEREVLRLAGQLMSQLATWEEAE